MTFLLLAVAGLVSGIISGMGIGGGTILIPCLTIFFGMDQQTAQGINLLYFIPTGIAAVILHAKNKRINKPLVKGLVLYGLAGAVMGSLIALSVNQESLKTWFGYFLLSVGVHEIFSPLKRENAQI